MDTRNCIYCQGGKRLTDLMIEIGPVGPMKLFLFRNQSYRGRCVLAWPTHVEEVFQLKPDERVEFVEAVGRTASALKRAFGADKINYGIFGDTMPHLHVHVVPKFDHAAGWGKPFEMNPQPGQFLTEAGYEAVIELVRNHL